jgi:plasmid stabilization system protein ParE
MAKYILTEKAEEDMDEILKYVLDKSNEKTASLLLNAVHKTCKLISRMPRIGRRNEAISSEELYNLAVDKFSNYLLFYVLINDVPVIVRIIHGKRDIPMILNKWWAIKSNDKFS